MKKRKIIFRNLLFSVQRILLLFRVNSTLPSKQQFYTSVARFVLKKTDQYVKLAVHIATKELFVLSAIHETYYYDTYVNITI